MKKIGILGSTGSIGTQTLQVIDQLPGKFDVKYLTTQQNIPLIAEQALKYHPDTVCIIDEQKKEMLKNYILHLMNLRIIYHLNQRMLYLLYLGLTIDIIYRLLLYQAHHQTA